MKKNSYFYIKNKTKKVHINVFFYFSDKSVYINTFFGFSVKIVHIKKIKLENQNLKKCAKNSPKFLKLKT